MRKIKSINKRGYIDFEPQKKTEHGEQAALFDWAKAQEGIYPELRLMHAIPNGGHRHVAVAVKMKKEGVKRGVPDVFLPCARGAWHGLYLEMKVKPNTPSEDQQEWLEALNAQGYAAVVAWSFEEARGVVEGYLKNGLQEAK